MVFKYLESLKSQTTDEQFREILEMADQDIKFNRVGFKKTTAPRTYIDICDRCKSVIIAC